MFHAFVIADDHYVPKVSSHQFLIALEFQKSESKFRELERPARQRKYPYKCSPCPAVYIKRYEHFMGDKLRFDRPRGSI